MSAAWPLVKNRLVVLLPDLPGWSGVSVYSGPPVTGDAPTRYVTVGFVPGEDFAGSYEQTYTPGGLLEEVGTVRSEVVCATGDVDLPAMEADAFALVDAWEASITADGTLGVLPQGSTSALSVDVEPSQTTSAAAQRLVVTLSYTARGL